MPQSHFDLFNLQPRFALPGDELDAAYRRLAAQVHPDRYANADPTEQRQALSLATNVNEAYRILRRPVLRAQYLLNLRGIDPIQGAPSVLPNFLMEQMDWREGLSDAQAERDVTTLQRLYEQVHWRADVLLQELEQHLDGDGELAAAAQAVQQLMFIDKLLLDIDEARALLEA